MISLGQKSRNNKVIRVIHRHKHVGLPKIAKKETSPQKNISEAISELNRERDSITSNTNQISKLKQLLLSGNDVRGQLQKKINEAVNQQNNKNTIIENQKKQLNQIKQNLKNQQLAMKNLVNSKNVSQKTSYGNQPQAKQQQVNSKNSRNRPQTNIRYQSQIQQQQQQKRQRPQWTVAGQIVRPWDHEQQHAILDLIEKYKRLYKKGIQDLINFQQKCKKQAEETQKAQNVLYKKKETAWRVESDKKDTAWRTESVKAKAATQVARKARDKAQLAKLVAKDRELSTRTTKLTAERAGDKKKCEEERAVMIRARQQREKKRVEKNRARAKKRAYEVEASVTALKKAAQLRKEMQQRIEESKKQRQVLLAQKRLANFALLKARAVAADQRRSGSKICCITKKIC